VTDGLVNEEALAILRGDILAKGGAARGGKYYKRIPKSGGGYRYFYTQASYAQHMGRNHTGAGNAKIAAAKAAMPVLGKRLSDSELDTLRDAGRLEAVRADQLREGDVVVDTGQRAASVQVAKKGRAGQLVRLGTSDRTNTEDPGSKFLRIK